MGKHEAPEGAAVDPIVADALARRAADGGEAPAEPAPDERTGAVGWPEPPAPGGGGLGWPGEEPAQDVTPQPAAEALPVAQKGWRRLFRPRSAA